MSYKGVPQECLSLIEVSYKSVSQGASYAIVQQEYPARVSHQSPLERLTRVSHLRVSNKSVLQECPTE